MMRTFLPPSMRIAVSAGVPWSVAPAKSTVMLSPRITTPEIRYVRRRTRADRVMTWPECSAIGALGPCVSRRASSSMVPTYASHATPAAHRPALRGIAARDCPGAAGPAPLVAPQHQQGTRVYRLHRRHRRAVHDHGRHSHRGIAGRHPAGQYGDARDWSGALQFAGHDRRLGPADPPAAPRQPAPQARRAHRRLFHLHRRELRRTIDADRRPPAAPRLPEGRAIYVDAQALAAMAGAERHLAGPLQYLGPMGESRRSGGAES